MGGLGGHKLKCLVKLSNGSTDWHQIWYMSADSSGNGHNNYLNTIRPSIPQGPFRGVLGGQQIKYGKATKRMDRLAPNSVNVCVFIWEWTYAKNKSPHNNLGGILGGFKGSQIQMSGEAVKRLDRLAPNVVHVCGFVWE